MKLNNVNVILIFILCVLSITLIVTLLRKRHTQSNNNIDNGIDNSINRLIGIKEKFQTESGSQYTKQNKNTEDSTEEQISSALQQKPSTTTQHIDSLNIDDDENENNTAQSLDKMFENLKNLEDKCNSYEEGQRETDDKEKQRHEESVQEQLDIENVKINELTEIVNFYRKKYQEKMTVNSQCRENKFNTLETNINKLNTFQTGTDGALNEQELYLKFNKQAATSTTIAATTTAPTTT
tara:strand:+ start:1415 stop:2128 length:714 start_codon:yes stop_codon:yes gene_type:complete